MYRIERWSELPFFHSIHIKDIFSKLDRDVASGLEILPKRRNIFKAFECVKPNDVRVCIIGQDPYPTPGHANGLAFSVSPETKPFPRSLQNIFKELVDDIGCPYPTTGDLSKWAKQGVFLLNTSLTVIKGQPGSHSEIGWQILIEEILKELASRDITYILWGKHAQSFEEQIPPWCATVKSAHPSPFSADKGFFGSKPFSKTNANLKSPIDWSL